MGLTPDLVTTPKRNGYSTELGRPELGPLSGPCGVEKDLDISYKICSTVRTEKSSIENEKDIGQAKSRGKGVSV